MGSFRSSPDTNKHTINKQGLGLSYAVSHMCGMKPLLFIGRSHLRLPPLRQEILFVCRFRRPWRQPSQIIILGAQVATFVERHFVKELEANANFKKERYELALKETFLRMDELLREQKGKKEIKDIQKQLREIGNGPSYEEQSHAGCTANVWLVTPDYIYVANSGDSRGVACINGAAKEMSKDHKPDDKVEYDRIKKAGGQVSFGRVQGNLNLSRALGDLQYKQNTKLTPEQQMITANPDISKLKNENIEFVIIGCDGIWEVKTCDEMVKWVKRRVDSGRVLGDILEQLLGELVAKDGANSEYGMDNMSAILVKFNKKK